MKNKIIFKTLMLKGEAGSTIVSMEKTGHVGTADIYTITFNDGSTTEISLENMSAITSVEKTSSTDTEDIYTITCADGSTQTFSVLNHNADIAAMSDDIDTIDARVDNFINSVVPNTVETLWTGSIKDVGDSATLSKAVSNFDYIDLYLLGSADSKYIRVPATQTDVQIQQQNLSDNASSNFLRLWEMGVSISGSTVSITKSIAWAWDDPNNSNPTVTANAQNGVPITRIDGVKIASDSPAELVDIRVGADGVTYNSAGDAVRGQYSYFNNHVSQETLSWKLGTLNPGTGIESASTARIVSAYIPVTIGTKVSVSGGANCLVVYEYDKNGVYISDSSWADGNIYVVSDPDAAYIRILVRKSDNGTISSDEIATQGERCSVSLVIPANVYDFDSEIESIEEKINAAINGITINHSETVTVGAHTYSFDSKIPSGKTITIKNNSTTTAFTVNLVKIDGTYESINSGQGIQPNSSITVATTFDVYGVRCYCSNTDWNFTITYGLNVLSKINTNADAIEKIIVRNSVNDDWGVGTLNNGIYDSTNNYRITDKTYIPIFNGCKIVVIPLNYVIHYYDANKNYISNTGWIAKKTVTTISNNAAFIRIACAGASTFTTDDLATYADCIDIEYQINDCIQYLKENQSDIAGDIYKTVLLNSFNSAFHNGASNWATKCATYNQLFNDSEHIESFLFFTDPHFFTRDDVVWQERMPEFIAEIQKYYNSTPTSFCLCGGDWLTAYDSNNTALFRLGYVDGFMNAMFDNYYPMFGNHDDNYQGATTDGGTPATATPLDKQTLVNLWFKKFGKAYYAFEGTSTKFYVFDSGNDWNTNMTDYRWEQIDWFCTSLLSDTSERIAVAIHDAYNSAADYTSDTLFPMTDYIGQVIEAYNDKTTITLNDKTYDFSTVTGSIKFIIAGHLHADGVKTVYGVPLILTINTQAITTSPSFDLVYVDYDNNVIKLVRVGSGSDRTVNL